MRRTLRELACRSIPHRRIAVRLCDARHHRGDRSVIELAQCNDCTQSRQSIRMRRQSLKEINRARILQTSQLLDGILLGRVRKESIQIGSSKEKVRARLAYLSPVG